MSCAREELGAHNTAAPLNVRHPSSCGTGDRDKLPASFRNIWGGGLCHGAWWRMDVGEAKNGPRKLGRKSRAQEPTFVFEISVAVTKASKARVVRSPSCSALGRWDERKQPRGLLDRGFSPWCGPTCRRVTRGPITLTAHAFKIGFF
jgi:hypothetical protein